MANSSENQNFRKKWETQLPEAVFDEEAEEKRQGELEYIQTRLAEKQRDSDSFITANRTLFDIAELIRTPSMWVSTACTIPGLGFSGFQVIMGRGFSYSSVFDWVVFLAVCGFITLIYWNLIERFRLFATQKSAESFYNIGFSTKSRGKKKKYHNIHWYLFMASWFMLSMIGSGYSAWNIAITSGYKPQSVENESKAHFDKYEQQMAGEQTALNEFVAKKETEIKGIENSRKYTWQGALLPEGKKRIESINTSVNTEQAARNKNIEALRIEKNKLYDDGSKKYNANINDMLSAAQGNGGFAIVFILLVELAILLSVWFEEYYISGCIKEQEYENEQVIAQQRQATQNKITPPTAPPVIAPSLPDPNENISIKDSILTMNRLISAAASGGRHTEMDKYIDSLDRFRKMGYNTSNGEYEGFSAQLGINRDINSPINTPINTVLTPEKEIIIIQNSPRLSKYPKVLEALRKGYTITQTMNETGVSKSIVQDVRREGKFHGILLDNEEE